jgi:hypothetical protein
MFVLRGNQTCELLHNKRVFLPLRQMSQDMEQVFEHKVIVYLIKDAQYIVT